MMNGLEWNLDKASAGSHVVVRDRWRMSELHTVKSVSKTRVVLDDDTVWTRRGKKWGSSNGRGWSGGPSACFVADLPKAQADIAQERAERELTSLREKVSRLDGRKLTREQCEAILATAEPTPSGESP